MASTIGRYTDIHGKKPTESYVTYLELQLDKVTAACSAAQKQGERIDTLSGQVTSMEEKIANLTKVMKLIQSYTEGQEQEALKLRQEFQRIGQKPLESELMQETMMKRIEALERKLSEKTEDTPYVLNKLILASEQKLEDELNSKLSDIRTEQKKMEKAIERQGVDIAQEITAFEGKLKELQHSVPKLEQNQSNFQAGLTELMQKNEKVHQSNEVATKIASLEAEMKKSLFQTDELCGKLVGQLFQRIKTLEESVHKGVLARKADELTMKQQKEFAVLKKSLISSVEAAVEGMKAGIKGMTVQKKALTGTAGTKSKSSVKMAEKKGPETVVDSFNLGKQSTPHAVRGESKKGLKKKRRSVSATSKEERKPVVVAEGHKKVKARHLHRKTTPRFDDEKNRQGPESALSSKDAKQRLSRLEKIYQELTLDAKME